MAKSEYEEIMGDRAGKVGRLPGGEIVFSTTDKDRNLARKAQSRALVVLRKRHAEELRDIYESEYEYLAEQQGYEEIQVVETVRKERKVRRDRKGA